MKNCIARIRFAMWVICEKLGINPPSVLIENDEGWGMSPEPGFGCIHHQRKS